MRCVSWLVLITVFSAVSCGNISAPKVVASDKSSVKKEVVLTGPVFQFPTANRELLNDGGETNFLRQPNRNGLGQVELSDVCGIAARACTRALISSA